MTVDLHPLIKGEQKELKFNFAYDVTELSPDLQSGNAVVNGKVVNHSGYMQLDADIAVTASALCGRCDDYFDCKLDFDMQCPVATELANADEHDEYLIAPDGVLDLDEAVRCFISLSLPTRFLCSEDCKGLCHKCGKNLNEGDCGCDTKETDPRWAALKNYFD